MERFMTLLRGLINIPVALIAFLRYVGLMARPILTISMEVSRNRLIN